MATVHSFPPIVGISPKILILGSSPGVISVKKQQYFAHPRNAFWPIMAELFGMDISQGYLHSISQFKKLPIILWDSLKNCEREGSLDSAIKQSGVMVNDFSGLLNQYSGVETVFCNGGASFKWFRQLALPTIEKSINVIQLPSTSPAHAAMSFAEKLAAWKQIKDYV